MTELMKELDVKLSDKEIRQKGHTLAARCEEIERTKLAAKAAAKVHNDRVKELEKERQELARNVSTGRERRQVLCKEVVDDRRLAVDIVRMDIQEVVESRPMTESELEKHRQPGLPGISDEDADAEDGAVSARDDQRTETGTLANHPVIQEMLRAPAERVPCPGPNAGGVNQGCGGDTCTRCAGAGFIPAASVDAAAPEQADEATPEHEVVISDPGAVLAAAEGAPEAH